MDLGTIDLNDLAQLQLLQKRLNELGAPDPDEGARLHAEKNAPHVSGIYSHLKFPAYQFKPYPRALYSPDYPKAKEGYDRALRIPARGVETGERDAAITLATRALNITTKLVHTESEYAEARNSGWCETPDDAATACEQRARGVAHSAAEAAYDDKRLGEKARAERDAIDADHDGHLIEIPETPKAGPRTRVAIK